jgi:hypothetical protein
VSSYHFLSPEWIEAARQVRDEYADRLPAAPLSIRANVVVTEAPFDGGPVRAYLDTSAGALTLDLGALDQPELTIKIDYVTARRIFVDRDQNAAMEAFFSGRIVVEGDITKVLALQGQSADPVAEEIADRIAGFTVT